MQEGENPEWTRRARCRGLDPDPFFKRAIQQARPALKVCQRCRVREECLAYAIDNGIEIGVWGGLTERQRRAHARKLAAASTG